MDDHILPSYTEQAYPVVLPVYPLGDGEHSVAVFILTQSSPSSQILCEKETQRDGLTYTIKSFATGGFMNKRPHMIISSLRQRPSLGNGDESSKPRRFSVISRRQPEGPRTSRQDDSLPEPSTVVAKVRFATTGPETIVEYSLDSASGAKEQTLSLESSHSQILRTLISTKPHWCQPSVGNKNVLELRNDMDEIVARFTFSGSRDSSTSAGLKKSTPFEVGELEIVEDLSPGASGIQEIIVTFLAVVERAKRRAEIIGKAGVGYRQGAACGMTTSMSGGGAG